MLERLEALLDGNRTASARNGAASTNGVRSASHRSTTTALTQGASRRALSPSAALTSQPSVRSISDGAAITVIEVPSLPLDRCRAILDCSDSLRQALLRQAKVLDFLASASLTTPPVDLRLDAAGVDPPPPPLGTIRNRSASPGGRRPSAKGPATTTTAAMPKGSSAVAAAADAAVKLAVDVEGVIDVCKKETESVAKAYYAAKVAFSLELTRELGLLRIVMRKNPNPRPV